MSWPMMANQSLSTSPSCNAARRLGLMLCLEKNMGWTPSYNWLVVWNMTFIFPSIGNNNPIWPIFFTGVGIPPTSKKHVKQPWFRTDNPWEDPQRSTVLPAGQENVKIASVTVKWDRFLPGLRKAYLVLARTWDRREMDNYMLSNILNVKYPRFTETTNFNFRHKVDKGSKLLDCGLKLNHREIESY